MPSNGYGVQGRDAPAPTPRFVIVLLTCPDTLERGLTLTDRLKQGIVLIPNRIGGTCVNFAGFTQRYLGRRIA